MLSDNNRQKSLKRRFLLILGVTVFIVCSGGGLFIIFWPKMLPNLSQTERIGFGAVFIIYGVLRFARLLKKDPDEV